MHKRPLCYYVYVARTEYAVCDDKIYSTITLLPT